MRYWKLLADGTRHPVYEDMKQKNEVFRDDWAIDTLKKIDEFEKKSRKSRLIIGKSS